MTLASCGGWIALSAHGDSQISQANAYTVVAPPSGVSLSQANAYTVVAPPSGVSLSQAVAYAVVIPELQPSVFIKARQDQAPPADMSATPLNLHVAWHATLQPSIFINSAHARPLASSPARPSASFEFLTPEAPTAPDSDPTPGCRADATLAPIDRDSPS